MNMTVNLGTKDFPKDISKEFLDGYVGKKIEDICGILGKPATNTIIVHISLATYSVLE